MHIALMPSGSKKGWAKLILAIIIIVVTWGSASSGVAGAWAGSANAAGQVSLSMGGMMAMSFGVIISCPQMSSHQRIQIQPGRAADHLLIP